MNKLREKLKDLWLRLSMWASVFEPVRARMAAAVVFQVLVAAGVAVGPWPHYVDVAITALTVAATALAGHSIRKRVDSPATVARKEVDAARRARAQHRRQ